MIDDGTLARVIEFHGHMCAGLAMGIRAAEVGLAEIGPHAADEEVVAVVETDMCGIDAIQFLTGCTLGKGNLVHRDHGKNVYTFIRRSDGRAVRVSSRPGGWGRRSPEWQTLFAKMRARSATSEERDRFAELQREQSERVLNMAVEDLYEVREVEVEPPMPARILASIDCECCHEPTMESRIRRLDGAELCLPCFEEALSGTTRVSSPSPQRRPTSSRTGETGVIASPAAPERMGDRA